MLGSGVCLNFEQKDLFTGLHDRNQNAIYAEDILEIKTPMGLQNACLVHDDLLSAFQLLSIDGEDLFAENALLYLRSNSFRRISYNFKQKLN